VSHFAVALARSGSAWSGAELDLTDVEDVDGLVDAANGEVGDGSDLMLIAVEEDDESVAGELESAVAGLNRAITGSSAAAVADAFGDLAEVAGELADAVAGEDEATARAGRRRGAA